MAELIQEDAHSYARQLIGRHPPCRGVGEARPLSLLTKIGERGPSGTSFGSVQSWITFLEADLVQQQQVHDASTTAGRRTRDPRAASEHTDPARRPGGRPRSCCAPPPAAMPTASTASGSVVALHALVGQDSCCSPAWSCHSGRSPDHARGAAGSCGSRRPRQHN